MCLLTFRFSPGRDAHLVLVANRDEFHERPTRIMAWQDGWLAGRDEVAGGTWLALARDGRWAALTNVRDPNAGPAAASRGELPLDYLASGLDPGAWARVVADRRRRYAPFNLLLGSRDALWYVGSRTQPQPVSAGVHALSNGCLDEPWPKSRRAAVALRGLLDSAVGIDPERLLGLMHDRDPAPDPELPDTGVGLEMERFLSPPFIVGERYGTRSTTLLVLDRYGLAIERSFDRQGRIRGQIDYRFELRPGGRSS